LEASNVTEKFKKYNHVLLFEDNQSENVTIGITTREQGKSAYPNDAFNMARYIDDEPTTR
jgi:copper oxidase (laccase) domain-containing protein